MLDYLCQIQDSVFINVSTDKISTFGLLEMTRQRLREGSIIWETNLSLESFALKLVKKSEMLSFEEKVKSVSVQIPEKVKIYIDKILKNLEINPKTFSLRLSNQNLKDELKKRTQEAYEKGVFGAPTFLVNNKIFWGQDRLEYALDELVEI